MKNDDVSVSGWGRYPIASAIVNVPRRTDEIAKLCRSATPFVPRGNGRAYGDAALFRNMVSSDSLDYLMEFDTDAGTIDVESGITLNALLRVTVPQGWFLPVTPGTSYASVGGCIAADVHGKNHHVDGTFGRFVDWIDVIDANGEQQRLSPDAEPEWFDATLGGMGLTGFIVAARLRLKRIVSTDIVEHSIRCPTADSLIDELMRRESHYSVAWVDLFGKEPGRGVLGLGEHIDSEGDLNADALPRARSLPALPFKAALGDPSIALFNKMLFAKARDTERTVSLGKYFYPLDSAASWNLWYGRRGFVQHQCVIPLAESRDGLPMLYREVGKFRQKPYLAVLKLMGDASDSPLSFPMRGFTLAMDFPRRRGIEKDLARLDAIVGELGGRIYLAKDALSSRSMLESGYPKLDRFRELRRKHGLDSVFQSDLSIRMNL